MCLAWVARTHPQWIRALNAASDAGLSQVKSPAPSPLLAGRQPSTSSTGGAGGLGSPPVPSRSSSVSLPATPGVGQAPLNTSAQYLAAANVAFAESRTQLKVGPLVRGLLCPSPQRGKVEG
jgi:hypothetical protein